MAHEPSNVAQREERLFDRHQDIAELDEMIAKGEEREKRLTRDEPASHGTPREELARKYSALNRR